jgi:5'-methylthioadenosine phosphorylase
MEQQAVHIGVLGGSGLYQMEDLENVREVEVNTPFGAPSDTILIGERQGIAIAFLPRHGRGHVHLPSEVPYRANIYALKSLGVQQIISVSACGSLREHMHPGDIVIPDQLFDFTKHRQNTFFGEGLVAHISVAEPFCPRLSGLLAEATATAAGQIDDEAEAAVHVGGNFITIEGPRFSTKAESYTFRAWGMDIIGMTASPEAYLAREAGLCYATMAHITDYDVWHESEEAVTVEMVIQQLNANIGLARRTIAQLAPRLVEAERTCDCAETLKTAIITARHKIPPETREKLRLITGPYLG